MYNNPYGRLITALITPLLNNKKIDFLALKKLLQRQIESSIETIVICGSTGESVLLSPDEILEITKYVKNYVKEKIKIIGGISTASLELAVFLAKQYQDIGIDGIMCSPPYYIKPRQNQIYNFFQSIAAATNLPIMIYNIPSRSGSSITNDLILKLSKIDNIIALKDASCNLETPLLVKASNSNLSLFSGDDATSLGFIAQGGDGAVSVASNILPKTCKKIQDYAFDGNFKEALILHKKLLPLYQILSIEPNPIPVKYILSKMELCHNYLKLPLTALSNENMKSIDIILNELKII